MIHKTLVILLAFLSFLLAAVVSRTVFERLPHLEDEVAYLFQARVFANGEVTADVPQPSLAYWQPFVITMNGKRFSKYTPGWSFILSLGVSMGQAWVINAFCAMLTVSLTYRIGKEIFHPDVGIIAAALVTFSPMALLLNGTLMGHSAALTCLLFFILAYWRIEQGHHGIRWGIVGGVALGLLVINRQLTAASAALPFILWSIIRLPYLLKKPRELIPPYVMLALITLIIAAAIPLYNHITSGDYRTNLYRKVWDYDRVGFGEGYGRNGHTIIKGVAHARYDLSLTAADLFGWVLGEVTPEVQEHLRTQSDYFPLYGLSFFILPFGLLAGFRRWWMRAWVLLGLIWLIPPLVNNATFLITDEAAIWRWLMMGILVMLLPLIIFAIYPPDHQTRWTWFLLAIAVCLIGGHMAYWVGSQRYSTRYYFEALPALAIIAALAFDKLFHQLKRFRLLYFMGVLAFTGLICWSYVHYSVPRIQALYQFNGVTQAKIEAVAARRIDERPILVIVTSVPGSRFTWRGYGSLIAVTDPYFENDIIVARDYNGQSRDAIIQQFPNHQVIDMTINYTEAWFTGDCDGGNCG